LIKNNTNNFLVGNFLLYHAKLNDFIFENLELIYGFIFTFFFFPVTGHILLVEKSIRCFIGENFLFLLGTNCKVVLMLLKFLVGNIGYIWLFSFS